MNKSFITLLCVALYLPAVAHSISNCPVTRPGAWPAKNPEGVLGGTSTTHDWYGDASLAALLPLSGRWTGQGSSTNFSDKFWWWRAGFDAKTEPVPELVIQGMQLDQGPDTLFIESATAGYGPGWNAMLVGLSFPSPGCWELRGVYNGSQELVVVLEVGEFGLVPHDE